MFDILKNIFTTADETSEDTLDLSDLKLCCAALLVQVLTADGVVRDEEVEKLQEIVQAEFGLSEEEALSLYEQATEASNTSVDLYGFTHRIKMKLSEDQRIDLVKQLWQIVFADGYLHEMEDNVVWRIAELLGVSTRDRMLAKKQALAERG